MKQITVDQIMELKPCGWDKEDNGVNYTREHVNRLFAGRETMTALEILALEDISINDRFWATLRFELIEEIILYTFICDCAEHVLPLFECVYPDNKGPRQAIETRRHWLCGEVINKELDAANAAARAAIGAIARAIANAAAGATAKASAGSIEREWQLARLKELLTIESES